MRNQWSGDYHRLGCPPEEVIVLLREVTDAMLDDLIQDTRLWVSREAKDRAMTVDEFEVRVEKLVVEAREVGMPVEVMIDVLHDVAENLREAVADPADKSDQ
jgi:hypothetical protein